MSTERYETDSPEDIQKCLNCTKKECDNCLSSTTAIKEYRKRYRTQEMNIQRRKRYAQNKEKIKEKAKISALKKYLRENGL